MSYSHTYKMHIQIHLPYTSIYKYKCMHGRLVIPVQVVRNLILKLFPYLSNAYLFMRKISVLGVDVNLVTVFIH